MSLDILKISPAVKKGLLDSGYTTPTEIQEKSVSRIIGGQNLICAGMEGVGKTTAMISAILTRIKFAHEIAPRALILVPTREKGEELIERFQLIGKNTDIRILGLFSSGNIESQRDDLADGTDIVIGTPDRVQLIYNSSGLNLNKIISFVLDDADLIVQKGFHTPIVNFTESLPKCQNLVFTDVINPKLERLIEAYMTHYTIIEASTFTDSEPQNPGSGIYILPNFKTKLNLLNLFLEKKEQFPRLVVFTNSQTTAETLYKSLIKRMEGEVVVLEPEDSESTQELLVNDIFIANNTRVLISYHLNINFDNWDSISTIHFDVPEQRNLYVDNERHSRELNVFTMMFALESELRAVKKIEHLIGKAFKKEELPSNLLIEPSYSSVKVEEKANSDKEIDNTKGAAFHEKKEKNAKEFNYKFKDKLKAFGKKNRKNKKG